MSYFVPDGGQLNSAALRSNADLLGSSLTLLFKQKGDYWLRIDSPLIGEQISLLSDVTLSYGTINRFINVTETGFPAISFYQLQSFPQSLFFSQISESVKTKDEVLKNLYPGFQEFSMFDKLIIGAGRSSANALNEFYLKVSGDPGVFDKVDDGRVLVTRGETLGKRDAAWGNWLDVEGVAVEYSDGAKELIRQFDASAANELVIEAKIEEGLAQLTRINTQLAGNKLLLNAIDETSSLQTIFLALQSLKVVIDTSELIVSNYSPAGKLAAGMKGAILTIGAVETYEAFEELREQGGIKKLAEFNLKAADFLLDASKNSGVLGIVVGLASTGYDIYKILEEYQFKDRNDADIRAIQSFIEDLSRKQRILEDSLIDLRKQQVDNGLKKFSIQSTSDEFKLESDASVIAAGVKDGVSFDVQSLANGKISAFSLQGDLQTAVVKAGEVLIDGGDSTRETVQLSGARATFTSSIGQDAAMFLKSGTKVLVSEVDRVRFDDGTLRLDINLPGQGASNAGSAYRMYEAAFNRTPDSGGMAFWIRYLDGGRSIADMAQGFVGSAEFRSVYGDDPSAVQLVTGFYTNILGRAPEKAGLDFWVGVLNNKPEQRSYVLSGIANSAENQSGLIGVIGQGIWVPGEIL